MRTNIKMVVSGDIVELIRFAKPVICGEPLTHGQGPGNDDLTEEEKQQKSLESRQQSFKRAKRRVKRLLNRNVDVWKDHNGSFYIPQLVTITFKENRQDIKEANRDFSKFIQRLNYWVTGSKKASLQYLAVIEFQKRGAIHYHRVFYNLPQVKCDKNKFISLWGLGSQIDIRPIGEVSDIGGYVSKYMTKDSGDERLIGEKSYFCSQGLKQPFEIKNLETIVFILSFLDEDEAYFEKTFPSDFQGDIDLKLFNLSETKSLSRSGMELILAMKYPKELE